ncbi:hypothetical protein B6D29_01240 [Microgenomates bacterium UTCPR1]|nr:cytochrome b5 domain-containing protein [Patescibacteria group bacterium]OQY68172.1 MAG: hypothetical protein B6D29_01240 [Microgenomates bacterium UTCPR1]
MNLKKEISFGIAILLFVLFAFAYFNFRFGLEVRTLDNTINNSEMSGGSFKANRKEFASGEISKHNSKEDCWLIIDGSVYNVTEFIDIHPGGAEKLIALCGQDASLGFETKDGIGSHSQRAKQELATMKIGDLKN